MARQKNDGRGRLGGRTAGTPNKVTADLREWISCIIDNGREQFIQDLKALEPIDRIRIYTSLLNYVLPKQAPISPEPDKSNEPTGLTIIVQNDEDADLIKRISEH